MVETLTFVSEFLIFPQIRFTILDNNANEFFLIFQTSDRSMRPMDTSKQFKGMHRLAGNLKIQMEMKILEALNSMIVIFALIFSLYV